MRGRAGSVPKISLFLTEISVSGLEILPYEHFIPVTGMNGGMNSGGLDGIVLHCLLYFPHDTALRVTDAKMGPKVKIFVFRYVCFVSRIWRQNSSQDLWPFLISETGLKFLIWTQGKIHPGNRASPVNRVHMKRPLVASFYCICLPKSVLKAYTDSSQAFYLPFSQLKRSFPFRFFLSFFLPLIPRDFSLVLIVT